MEHIILFYECETYSITIFYEVVTDNISVCFVVIHHLKSRHVGIDCLKTAPALLLIKGLKESGKVRLLQGPMNGDCKMNIERMVLILNLMYPGATVSIATNNKLLRF